MIVANFYYGMIFVVLGFIFEVFGRVEYVGSFIFLLGFLFLAFGTPRPSQSSSSKSKENTK